MANLISSLAPVEADCSRLLILGSMPGRQSLARQQYYAHPRNAFWPIMTTLLGGKPGLSYPARLEMLKTAGISLWDVIGSCRRTGSLDAAIPATSEIPNPIDRFCQHHPELKAIAFNGGRARDSFRRHFLRRRRIPATLQLIPLPSTSPAYAGLRPPAKLALWLEHLAPYLPTGTDL